MLAAAGIVVTEMSTPISAPDLAVLRLSIPAAPAHAATKKAKKSGWEMRFARLWSSSENVSGNSPVALKISDRDVDGRDREREADGEREGRAQREPRLALHERDAEARERAELGPDDHRADDQDRGVLVDADRGEQRREHHEREEDPAQLDVLVRVRLDLLPHDGVGGRALGVLDGPLGVLGDLRVDQLDARSTPSLWMPSSLRSAMITLASSRATSARITSPSGRRAAPGRWTRCRPTASARAARAPARPGGRRDDPQVDHGAQPSRGRRAVPAPAGRRHSSKNSSRAATAVSGKSENRPSMCRA